MVFAADVNMGGSHSTPSIVTHLSGSNHGIGAPLFYSCCKNDGFHNQFDRIGATFGSGISAQMLFDPAPSWTNVAHGEFHKAVVGTIHASGAGVIGVAANASSEALLIV
jgi:hypothetical protein